MKKIYMILAAMTLLTMSLNAQFIVDKASLKTSQNVIAKVPQSEDLRATQYFVGPYTNSDLPNAGYGLPDYSGYTHFVGVVLEQSDFQQYLGHNVVGFRAAFYQENDVYAFFLYQIKLDDEGYYNIGSYKEFDLNSDGSFETLDGGEWHTFTVDPFELELEDGYNLLAIGYTYKQYSSSGYTRPVGLSTYHTGHVHFIRNGYSNSWSGASMSGDMSLQLIVEDIEQTATPNITYTINPDGRTVTVNVEGNYPDGTEIHMYVDGNEVPFPYVVGRGNEPYDIIVTATAKEEGKRISEVASRRITIPASELPMSAAPNIVYNEVNGNVTGELTWTCSSPGEVHIYVDGREVTSPWYLERLENDYTVVVRVTNLEDGHAMATTTQTITVHGLGTITIDDTWTELPGTYNNNDVINWGKAIMFIDRFTQSTKVYDDIKTKYVYHMEENKAVEPRKTNEKDVIAYKSISQVQGFYPLDSVTADTDRKHMKMNVVNANVKMNLEHNTAIYYYTLDRAMKHGQTQSNYVELSELQRALGGQYTEKGDFFKEETFDNFEGDNKMIHVDRLDSIDVATGKYGIVQGEYLEDYMNYVPVLWTFGFDRVNYENDKKNNSYGSPIWTVSPGDVRVNPGNHQAGTGTYLERQAKNQNGDWNPYVNWKDEGNQDCSLYILNLDADGFLPQIDDPDFQNVEYEPYMFRVWVECDGLRNYDVNPDNGWAVNNTTADRTSPRLIFEKRTDELKVVVKKDESAVVPAYPIPTNPETPTNIMFGATNSSSKHFYVRFYYRVKKTESETVDPENPEGGEGGQKNLNRDGDDTDPMYNGAEGEFDPDEYTDVQELLITGDVVDVIYYNPQGMQSDHPFDGVNIVVTRYSDGTTSTTKVIR